MNVKELQTRLGVVVDGMFGKQSEAALFERLSNLNAPALTNADFERVADSLGVPTKLLMAIREVEAPRGPFDDRGRPSILYEKHIFSAETEHCFDKAFPDLSASKWKPGTYGPFSAQYGKLSKACALHPGAAFKACSWGAFQVLGRNAVALGYGSAFDMALELTVSEAAHLDSFVRFVKTNGLLDELRACRAGNAASCVPFVSKYNGPGYALNAYHTKLAAAAL